MATSDVILGQAEEASRLDNTVGYAWRADGAEGKVLTCY